MAVYTVVTNTDPAVHEALFPPSPSDLPSGVWDWTWDSGVQMRKLRHSGSPHVLSFHAPGPAQALLCPRAESLPSSDRPLSSLCLRAQRGSWPGRSAGATGTTLQTAFHGHLFQGEPQLHPSPSGSEAPAEEAAEENQRAAAAEQAPRDLW